MWHINKKTFILVLISLFIGAGITGCKSKKKLAREQAAMEYQNKVETAKKNLKSIMEDNGFTLREKERILQDTKDMNLNEPEILSMIREAEEKIKLEKAEIRAKEEKKAAKEEKGTKETLEMYFNDIAAAPSVDMANRKANQALDLFSSPQVPVLIIISRSGNLVDYDRPTTIARYLNYLKDQKKNLNRIDNIQYDENGKISELELIKN
ncbi:MAG: hypothetical protein R6T99_04635 [Bacteroidales bacterium]